MADAAFQLDRFGGRFNADQGQILTAQDVDRIGDFALTSLINFLAVLFFDEANGEPISGFPRDELGTNHCQVTSTGDLSFEISTGWGMVYNAAATADEFAPTRYLPVVLDTLYEGDLDVHHATLPRIDIVCIAPAWTSDQPQTRNVKDPGTGVVTSTSIDARQRFGATITVVAGTPASTPTVPSVPAGAIEIARAYVPATSGAAVWKDHRPVLQIGQWLPGVPRYLVDDFVPAGGTDELEVSATSPASMAVIVERGRASINGVARLYQRQSALALTAAHATLDRIDLVVAQEDGTLDVVDGTAASVPAAPAAPANTVPLAEVLVEATVTSVGNSKITDVRERAPFTGTRLQAASVNHDRLSTPEVFARLGTPVVSGDDAYIPFALFYPDNSTEYEGPYDDGTAAGTACVFEVELFEVTQSSLLSATAWSASDAATDFTVGAGSLRLRRIEPAYSYAISGDDAISIAELAIVWYKPTNFDSDDFNQGGGPGYSGRHLFWCPERTGRIKLARAAAGRAVDYLVVVRPVNRPGGCTPNVIVSFT